MPVKFEGESEYDHQFKWLNSRKSAAYQPPSEEKAPVAGVASVESGLSQEPPIQRRKKPAHLAQTLPAHFDSASIASLTEDDFFLLGDTGKFAENVRYRNSRKKLKKSRDLKGKTYKIDVPKEDTENIRPAPKHEIEKPEPLKVQPAAEIPKLRETELRDPESKRRRSPEKGVKRGYSGKPKKESPVKGLKLSGPHVETPDAPREQKRVTQAVQTENRKETKEVAEQAKQADADLALQHRAGMKPARPASIKRLSEYQKQFQWKDGIQSSPLLAADQIVHKSASVLKSHVSLPRASEYQTQYQQPPKNIYTPPFAKPDGASPTKMAKPTPEVSESAPAVSKKQPLSEKDARLIKESSNPQKPFPPHGKHRRTKSEYASNFKSPQEFVYVDGSWRGARPAHHTATPAVKEASPPASAQSWFQEVIELRQKAEEYRKRALGTHISRMHTAQVLARNAELWDDVDSEESRTVSALSLETGSRASSHRALSKPRPVEKNSATRLDTRLETGSDTESERPRAKHAWADDESVPLSSASHRSLFGSESTDPVEVTPRDDEDTPTPRAFLEPDDSDEGRVPTPRLRLPRRHHLDKTTPSVGGALLTSPPQRPVSQSRGEVVSQSREREPRVESRGEIRVTRPSPKKTSVRQHHRHGYEWEAQCTCGADEHEQQKKEAESAPKRAESREAERPRPRSSPAKSHQASSLRQSAYRPATYGKPTSDSQPLLDEEASEDRVLATKYIPSPAPREARVERLGLDVPKTIDERFGETYVSPQKRQDDDDDDALSTSFRSIASSCSLASDTLERARQRRDHFWARDNKKVGTA